MNKYKFLIIISLFMVIFFVSKSYAASNNQTLLGKIIYLDPGHGGPDPGAIYKDIYEKDINLVLCQKLSESLKNKGATVYLTRETDKDLALNNVKNRKRSDLINRAYLINKTKPDIYISIHLNYIANSKWKGLQIFYNNKNQENEIIANKLTKYIKEKTYNVKDPKFNNTYYMYKNITSPGVLIEVGFLSNPDDRYRLTHEEYQDTLISNLTYSIESYFKKKD